VAVIEMTLTVIALLVAVGIVVQPALLVITTVTTSPFCKMEIKAVPIAPGTFTPFTCHWNVGALPPSVVLVINNVLLPAQVGLGPDVIDTDGVTELELTVIELLVVARGFAQAALLVITTVTLSPLLRVEEV